jgi:hypothetical protein
MELSNHPNVFEHIRLALEVTERARDRDIGFYLVELAANVRVRHELRLRV